MHLQTMADMLINSYSDKMFLKVSFQILSSEIKYWNIQVVLSDNIFACLYKKKVSISNKNMKMHIIHPWT